MKKVFSIVSALVLVLAISVSSIISVFAADDMALTINGEGIVNVGDTVKFTLYLDDTTEDIYAFEFSLFYDSEFLSLDKKSLTSDKFSNLIYNTNLEDKIPVNWTDISNPVVFSGKEEFLSCDFEVIKGGETNISQLITEIIGKDLSNIETCKWTYDLTVNGEIVVSGASVPTK
ncbi:MAG: hypothetical protein IJH96_01270 [Ruminococcus sp.]|nr:hypothetical protein [Ruminococcus sp.]